MTEAIQITGLKRTVRQMKKLDRDLVIAVKSINREAANVIAASARARAPRRSGDLAKTIRVGVTATSASVRAGSAQVPYAAPVHWGWPRRDIAPQPFMYEALDANRAEVIELYERRIRHVVDEAFRGGGS